MADYYSFVKVKISCNRTECQSVGELHVLPGEDNAPYGFHLPDGWKVKQFESAHPRASFVWYCCSDCVVPE